ncbi:MAG: dienelactone hydrolase family protein [Alphaproteobacteria bacterium]
MNSSKVVLIALLSVGFICIYILPRILFSPKTAAETEKPYAEKTIDEVLDEAFQIIAITENPPPQNVIKTTQRFNRYQARSGNELAPYIIDYFWYAPNEPWPENIKFPLIIHLHDQNSLAFSAEYMTQTNIRNNFPAFHFVPMLPPGATWANYKEDPTLKMLPYISEYIDYVLVKYPVDPKRIYLVGCGAGGHGAFGAIAERPDFYAAAVIINSDWNPAQAKKLAQTPLFMMMGEKNKQFSKTATIQITKDIRQLNGQAEYKEFTSMPHNCAFPPFYKASTWDWMFAHQSNETKIQTLAQ